MWSFELFSPLASVNARIGGHGVGRQTRLLSRRFRIPHACRCPPAAFERGTGVRGDAPTSGARNLTLSIVKIQFWLPGRFVVAGFRGGREKMCPLRGGVAKGQVLRGQRRFAEAIPEYETVLALNRNWVQALNALGQCKLFAGAIEETIPLVEQAIRLSPRDPQLGMWYNQIGCVHLLQSRTDEAILWLERARNATPGHPFPHAWLTSAHALRGETERAATELAEARRLSNSDRYSSISRLRDVLNSNAPKIRALFETTCFAGLRKAGVPEE
jgi:tetratricopeptide (TPR) repeat protein